MLCETVERYPSPPTNARDAGAFPIHEAVRRDGSQGTSAFHVLALDGATTDRTPAYRTGDSGRLMEIVRGLGPE